METITTEKEKVIKEEIEIYRAFDGKEFSSKADCARYELVHKYNLQKISTKKEYYEDYYELYTVKNIDELKEMILLDNNRDDFNNLTVDIDGIYIDDFDEFASTISFPMTLTEIYVREYGRCDHVKYMSLENIIAEQERVLKDVEKTLSELNKIKETKV